jgi:hypothetical protein
MRLVKRLLVIVIPQRLLFVQTLVLLVVFFLMFANQALALVRLNDRSLYVNNNSPGETSDYTVSFGYTTPSTIGSVDMTFCIDPIPYLACVTPPGLDVSHAVLSSQTGETGYTITQQTTNHMLLTRTASATGSGLSHYKFTGIVNPTYEAHSYAIRLADYASEDATGPIVNLGSVLTQINDGIFLQTQVPPMLIFCLAHTVADDCSTTNPVNYEDMGLLNPTKTLSTTSQMVAGTNATGGFAITINGTTLEAGTHVIASPSTPTVSAPGNDQFGLNLRANSSPHTGLDPTGQSLNAVVSADYDTSDKFMFKDGDVVASSPNVSLFRKFTTTYIVNSSDKLRAGVYTTTLTYICSGAF